ncbi:MAG: molybdenum cofactor biosynthesis protein MoaB [Anaerolineaceae bacterium]|nr:molybdenum cofactor biosynthesis protein MoaB [Anaerolineaceae bacterium]MCY3934615.1 molybdenum cofactor biosynthesis protein MoaB [Chloroflexota bacterium]MCY4105680.1 molybdenum cofactor biosynthesis protein MoaB [Chloroflexota bacterium]
MAAQEHRELAGERAVNVAIITVSDTRTPETDTNKHYLEERLTALGHRVLAYRLIPDEPTQVRAVLDELVALPELQLLLYNGGTGIARRDTTFDVISRLLEKPMPGFGELFRMLSYDEVGAAAMLSRATAGVYRGKLVFSLPGSNNAVRTAVEKLILPEIEHLAWEIVR